ncbi:MAG: ABC transporter permease, partial [Tissierellia bacterium]|nr:ABC transporter permease [Tissierellia bacterium]
SLSLVGIGTIIGYKSKNFNQNLTISSLVSYGIVFLSPIYYPIDNMNVVLRIISYLFPSTYAANIIRALILDSSSISNKEILFNLSVLLLFSILSFFILSKVFKWFLE